jgi:hypothetical protein
MIGYTRLCPQHSTEKNAAACYELARAATNEDEKVRWIVRAQDWLERADVWQASGDPPADQSTAQVGQ